MRYLVLTLSLSLIFTCVRAQNSSTDRSSFITTGLLQVKESANFGLVFNGPGISYGMIWNNINEKRLMTYEYELGLGVLFSREIPALGFYLKPVDFAWMFRLPFADQKLFVGPSLKLEYNYNLYPDLQSGFDYWYTDLGMGVNAQYGINHKSSSFIIKLNSLLVGFVSRQPDYRDPYFYDIGFKYAISHLHQDMELGSLNKFNATKLEIMWKPKADSRISIGYVFRYSGCYQAPDISMVGHSIKMIIGKK